jgi:hypothetical protein
VEDGIVTFMGSLALGATVIAIVLGLGKKYYEEEKEKQLENLQLKEQNDEANILFQLDRDMEKSLIKHSCESNLSISEILDLALTQYVENHQIKREKKNDEYN